MWLIVVEIAGGMALGEPSDRRSTHARNYLRYERVEPRTQAIAPPLIGCLEKMFKNSLTVDLRERRGRHFL